MKKLLVIGIISSSLVFGSCSRQEVSPKALEHVEEKNQSQQLVSWSGENTIVKNNESYWKNIQNFHCMRYKEPISEQTQIEGASQPFFLINEACESLSNDGKLYIVTVPYSDIYILRKTWSGANFEIAETHYVGFKDRSYTSTSWLVQDIEDTYRKVIKNNKRDGFQKRMGDFIPILFSNYSLGYNTNIYLKKEKNIKYCENHSIGSLCLVDITLEYDFVKNIVRETQACTYYIDVPSKAKKVLEPCVTF